MRRGEISTFALLLSARHSCHLVSCVVVSPGVMFAGAVERLRGSPVTDSGVFRAGGFARAMSAAVLVSSLLVGAGASGAGAQVSETLSSVDNVVVTETGVESPLRPGIASDLHFSTAFPLPVAGSDGFFTLEVEGDQFEIVEISLEGEVVRQTVTADAEVGGFIRPLQLTDEYLLAEGVIFEGPFTASVHPFRLDRSSGALEVMEETFDRSKSIRMSPDGDIVTGGKFDPVWQSLSEPGTGGGFVENGFEADETIPTMSSNGQYVAVAGERTVGGAVSGELWVMDTSGESADRNIELPCLASQCEYEVDAIAPNEAGLSVFVTAYSLSADGITRVNAIHHEVSVADGRVETSIPVSVVSPNGRYVAGMATTANSLQLSSSDMVIHDLETGRERSLRQGLPTSYAWELFGISDDGLTLRSFATVPCPAGVACVLQASFFGHTQLLPVADVTNGPAADQILRLYRAVFGRIPDEGGFDFWMSRYSEGEPLLNIVGEFAQSQEFADRFGDSPTDEELIAALYRNTLGRDGDADGVSFWLDRRADGLSIPEMLVAFADSPENIERTGTRPPITVAQGRVLRLYRAVLGREPDAGGLAFWVGEYEGGLSLDEMAEQFTGQPEYTQLYGNDPTDTELVDAVYLNVLRRPGDAGGVAFWLDGLEAGLTVPELFVAFADSPENIEGTGTVR